MGAFSDLVDEAASVDVSGWDFGWLDGRATEERPPWGYSRLLASRLSHVASALDVDTGGGEVIGEVPRLPPRMVVTEGWQPNVERARRLLSPRGVQVIHVEQGRALPFPDASFELVTSRHPVAPDWAEIARVLADNGTYLAQHVGPASAIELIERFLGRQPREHSARDPDREAAAARATGLDIVRLRTARCRMEFFDIGAVVFILRKCVWWVPGFEVERYREVLERLDAEIRQYGPFVAHSTRTLIEARRPPRWATSVASGPAKRAGWTGKATSMPGTDRAEPEPAVTRVVVLDQVLPASQTTHRVEVRRITIAPGHAAGLHVHNGPVFGSIESGSAVYQIEGQPESVLGPGDVFYEPKGVRIARFDAQNAGVTFLGYFLLDSGEEAELEFPDR